MHPFSGLTIEVPRAAVSVEAPQYRVALFHAEARAAKPSRLRLGSGRRIVIHDSRIFNILVGAWLIFSAFAWRHTATEEANTIFCGVLAVGLAMTAICLRPGDDPDTRDHSC